MARLFARNPEKAAQAEAVKREIARLKALSADEMATLLLPALGPDGVAHGHTVRIQQLCEELLSAFPKGGGLAALGLTSTVNRGLDRLEELGLADWLSYQRTPIWKITDEGSAVLAHGTLAARLARGE